MITKEKKERTVRKNKCRNIKSENHDRGREANSVRKARL